MQICGVFVTPSRKDDINRLCDIQIFMGEEQIKSINLNINQKTIIILTLNIQILFVIRQSLPTCLVAWSEF